MIGVPTQLPIDLDEFYKDLHDSGSDEDVTENLDKLKSLFRGSNLGKEYSRPGSRRDLIDQPHSHTKQKLGGDLLTLPNRQK